MLFHIVLSSKGLVAYGAMHTLLSRVFLPWRAAWPDVVKVAEHPWLAANGQGYLFFLVPLAPAPSLDPPMDRGGDGGSDAEWPLNRFSAGAIVGGG